MVNVFTDSSRVSSPSTSQKTSVDETVNLVHLYPPHPVNNEGKSVRCVTYQEHIGDIFK